MRKNNNNNSLTAILFYLKIIPPPSLVNQVPLLVKKYSLALQQPQLLDLIDTRWSILWLSLESTN
jgi:hypothetical protein